jgi:taurine dioxygenase
MATPLKKQVLKKQTLKPASGAIGAIVDGVDLHHPLDDATAQLLLHALHEHSVLFFHDQDLAEEEQLTFARNFGTVGQYPLAKLFGSTALTSTIEDTADSPPDADGWHTDITWVAEPPAYAFLNAKVIPERGGDTLWASLFAAYDALSPVMQELCCQLRVRHHAGPDFRERATRAAGPEKAELIVAEFPPVEHPLVRTHPVTGRRALFVAGGFMDKIVGMHRDESDALLGYLRRHVENPNFCVRWRWTEGDVAVWDEASTNHRALSDHYPAHRVMRRCTVDGGRPYFDPDQKGSE